MTPIICLLLTLIQFSLIRGEFQQSVVIEIPNYGKIVGLTQWYAQFYSFESIPYAKPPIGELRFKAPKKVEPWSGILDCTVNAPMCPQYYFDQLVGQEDCLYLNVYTPFITANAPLPVMVYIHGGGYMVGSGSRKNYGPEFFMESQNMVLVTINYRLGHLGSLSFKDQTQGVPGNAHLKDQLMALKWVSENIHSFGGGSSMTIFGESVGGASVHFHVISPLSQGIINKAIFQSGTALNPWAHGVLGTGEKLAERLEIKAKDTKDIITELQSIPFEEFMKKTQSPKELYVDIHVPHEFSPVVETQTNEPAFLPKPPLDLIKGNNFNKIPILLGFNDNDTLIMQVMRYLYTGAKFTLHDMKKMIPHDLNIPESEKDSLAKTIKETFFPNDGDMENVEKVSEFTLGPWFLTGYIQTIKQHLQVNQTNMLLYVFSTDSKLNFFKRLHPITSMYKGASHMDELGHLFTTKNIPCVTSESYEKEAAQQTVKIWTKFAIEGELTSIDGQWLPIREGEPMVYPYGDINGNRVKVRLNPSPLNWNFWSSLYDKYGTK